jgi:gas vesicle protein
MELPWQVVRSGFSAKAQSKAEMDQERTRLINDLLQVQTLKGEVMTTNGESKVSYLLIGLALGAVGGLMAALLVRKETREIIRDRSRKSLDYLNQQAGKLRETADVIVQQGKKLIACKRSDSVNDSTEAEKQTYQEDRREKLGG